MLVARKVHRPHPTFAQFAIKVLQNELANQIVFMRFN